MIVEKGHFHFAEKYWGGQGPPAPPPFSDGLDLHERALRLIHCDHSSNFQELLQRNNSVTIHQKNIQALAIMMYKVVNNIAPTTVSELFSFSNVTTV